MGDIGDGKNLWWEVALAHTGTMGHYASLGGSYNLTAAVGYSFIVDPLAEIVASTSANTSFGESSIVYHSLDTTNFNISKIYDFD
jgi:nitrilase